MKLHLATLSTQVVEMRTPETPLEGGVFEVEIFVDDVDLRKSRAPKEFFFRELAIHLAQAMMDTGIQREYWWCRFSKDAQIMFNLPEVVNMENG
ncbi:MAG: hypothetical protein E6Q97_24365 [Desulfurellales bacterium]|nr:MAG: hypothetical protein E6Q97_24365 [Desulfurellales bacterium]